MQFFTLTTDFITSNFRKFNEKYFQNELNTPNFRIVNVKSYLGRCCHNNVRYGKRFGTIEISTKFNRMEKEYLNTLLHEMIHLYIWQKNMKEPSGNKHHGVLFYHYAEIVNRDGWNISRCGSTQGGVAENGKKTTYELIMFKYQNKYYVCSILSGRSKSILSRYTHSGITNVTKFMSNDCRFGSLTKCRSRLGGRLISESEYREYCENYDCEKIL